MWSKVRSTLTKGRLFFVVKLFLIIVANNRIFLSIIENKQQETIFANFLSHFVDYRSANLRIIIALGMSVCSVIIQYNGAKVILKLCVWCVHIPIISSVLFYVSVFPSHCRMIEKTAFVFKKMKKCLMKSQGHGLWKFLFYFTKALDPLCLVALQ